MAKSKSNDEKVKPSEVEKGIGAKKLIALLKTSAGAYKDGRAIAGELGQKIASACEHDNLHRKAFATLRAMDRMSPEKLADYWDSLLYYVDISGIGKRAESAPRLDLSEGDGDENAGQEVSKTVKNGDGNVRPFPQPHGEAAE
jgi:hypothetical protein